MTFDYALFDKSMEQAGCRLTAKEPLRLHTTFKIGGPADRYVVVETERELRELLKAASASALPVLVLGKGSNLLVSDLGIRGVVAELAGEFKKVRRLEGNRIAAGSAASLAAVCRFAREQALSGLEFAWGIPGSAGGAAYMNAGAYGGEMKDIVQRVRHVSHTGDMRDCGPEELDFSYRHSRYTGTDDVITEIEYQLEPGNESEISAKMEDLMNRRKTKQPYEMPSAGSVFKRPEGYFAGTLIEECGLKGLAVGGAQVSPKHAGFIVNTGNATCADVLELIRQIKARVLEEKGVALECEVRVTGEVSRGDSAAI